MKPGAEASRALIEVENLYKIYRQKGLDEGEESHEVRALDGISLKIERGDFVAIMGQSGSGKSTLMQILGLLDSKSTGHYYLDGEDIGAFSEAELAELRSRKIGFIFQFFNLLPRTTAVNNIVLPMLYASHPNPIPRAIKLLQLVGLGDRLQHKPHQLSGGQQQRVAIARSLANQPQIIFADEPTGNISTEQSNEILNLLEELNTQGTTIALVTHEPDVAKRARRIITLRDGKLASDERLRPLPSWQKKEEEATKLEGKKQYWVRLKENIKMAFVALTLNKLRTALATLGIVIGIASVVAMVAIGVGAQQSIEQQLTSLGSNILTVYATNPSGGGGNMASGRNLRRFTPSDYEDLKRFESIDSEIDGVGAVVYGNVQASFGARNANTRIIGATSSYEKLQNATLIAGRFFSEDDDQQRRRVAILGQTVVKNLYGENTNPLGSFVKINRVEYMVIGILESKGAGTFSDNDDRILVPLNTGMYRILGRNNLDNLIVSVRSEQEIESAMEMLKEHIRQRRKILPDEEPDFDIRSLNEIRETLQKTTGVFSSLLAAIASISLLVGGIGIMNVMLVSVKERTREIGLRKALGAKRNDVLFQFLVESVLICLLGGLVGISLGWALSMLVSAIFSWSVLIPVQAVALAFGFSFLVGIVFGLWPAKQASELSPIEALRYE